MQYNITESLAAKEKAHAVVPRILELCEEQGMSALEVSLLPDAIKLVLNDNEWAERRDRRFTVHHPKQE